MTDDTRTIALEFAIRSARDGESSEDVVKRANIFHVFLTSQNELADQPIKEGEKPWLGAS